MQISTADICDAHLREIEEGQLSVLRGNWQWFGSLSQLQGQIVTLSAKGCNGEIRATLAEPGQGRVLIIDAEGHTGALIGDRLAKLAAENRWAGLLVNGNVRDRQALAEVELGILALGCWPERSNNTMGGMRDVPLVLGGLYINPEEWLYADDDGVLIAKRSLLGNHQG